MILCPTVLLAHVVDSNWGQQRSGCVHHTPVHSEGSAFVLWRNPELLSLHVQITLMCNAGMCNKHFQASAYLTRLFPHGTSSFLAPEDVSPNVFISVILTITPVMSVQAASFRIPFSTSHTQIGRCLSLLFQLYFFRLRCRRGTCFLDNTTIISPFFQVPLIWADMKTLYVYFLPVSHASAVCPTS